MERLILNLSTDHELMLSVRNGKIDQLGVLFERHHKSLYNFFHKQNGNRQFSEDLVQEVFLRMLKYRHTYRGKGKFTTWMFSIARNAQIDYFRKQCRIDDEGPDNSMLVSEESDPEEHLFQKSEHALLQKALLKLSPEKREVLVLSRFHHLKYHEISEILGCNVNTIKARVFRAIKDLTKIYHEMAGENLP